MAAHVDLGSHGTAVVLPVVGLRSRNSEREKAERSTEVGSPHLVCSGVSVGEGEGEESEKFSQWDLCSVETSNHRAQEGPA